MNAFQFIFQYIKRHKVQYTLGIITLFVVDFANIFIPKLTGVITDGLTAHSLDWSGVRLNLLYLFLLGLLLAVGRFFWRYFLFGASRSIEKERPLWRHGCAGRGAGERRHRRDGVL